jgi:hypothetical protein
MGFVLVTFARADEDLGRQLQILLKKSRVQARLLTTTPLASGGVVEQIESQLNQADVVLMIWSSGSESSAFLDQEGAYASDRRKLVVLRMDSTPLPRHGHAVVVDLRGRGLDSNGIAAVLAAIDSVRAGRVGEPDGITGPPSLDELSAEAPLAGVESEPAPASPLPDAWNPFIPDAPDAGAPHSPPAYDHFDSYHADLPPPAASRHFPDFVDTRAGDGVHEDIAFSRSSPASVRAHSPSLLGRLKRLGAKAVDLLGGGRAIEAPRSLPEEATRSAPPDSFAKPVLLAASAPRTCVPGTSFTAALIAYVAASREPAIQKLAALGEVGDRRVEDVVGSNWVIGAPVCIRLSAPGATVVPAEIRFEWSGSENLAAFSVTPSTTAVGKLQLGFQVFVADVMVTFLPMQLDVGRAEIAEDTGMTSRAEAPRTAFASYSSKDAENVAQRLSTLSRWSRGLDIFQDCLDLNPGETFKPQLARQIADRDVFLLFWSRQAAQSPWVKWEYTTALSEKNFAAILPMPLEDPAIAPPPPEFADLHLRDRFMLAGYALAKVREEAGRT